MSKKKVNKEKIKNSNTSILFEHVMLGTYQMKHAKLQDSI
jgi:hypothetical protein